MIKIQSYEHDLGWVNSTRAVDLHHGKVLLKAYRRDYPSEPHRLVDVDDRGAVKVISEMVDFHRMINQPIVTLWVPGGLFGMHPVWHSYVVYPKD